jgi:internalin A
MDAPTFRSVTRSSLAFLAVSGLTMTLLGGCGGSSGEAVVLTESELVSRERTAIERLKELGCKVQEAEDQWLQTSGILVHLAEEHIDGQGRIAADIFQEFRNLRRLFLIVDMTSIQSAGLAQLRDLDNLLLLSAQRTATDDDGLSQIQGIVSLRLLRLNWSKVSDDGLKYIDRLPDLLMLYLSGTGVTDEAAVRINRLKQLTALQLAHTELTDDGINQLTALTVLTHLGLNATAITDDCIPVLQSMTNLQYLNVSETQLSGDGLLRLGEALPDCRIVQKDMKDLSRQSP